MTYWRLHYHLIWATFERQPALTLEREKVFYGVLYRKAEELEMKIHAAGNVDDHVHVVLSIPPKLAVADCVKHIKGASAFAINHMPNTGEKIKWQEGYGVFSYSKSQMKAVINYIDNQELHHQKYSFIEEYRKTLDVFGITYDERYLFKELE